MEMRLLGTSGVRVSKLCLGTMTFGKEADEKASVAILDRALEAGINFIDTANIYVQGESESIIGRWIGPHREELILATKAHSPMGAGPNDRGSSRRHLLMAVEQSLKRLKTGWIDVLYLHQWDNHTALEESLAALTSLVESGKVLYIGVSNFSAWQTMKAIALCRQRGFAPITCIQPMYNLVKRQAEVEILPMAAHTGIGVCPYSPIGAGLLTGKYEKGQRGRLAENEMYQRRYGVPGYREIAARFVEFAEDHGYNPAALAVAWVAAHPAVTAPIVGARTLEQFDQSLGCLDLHLGPDLRREISALSLEPPLATDRERP